MFKKQLPAFLLAFVVPIVAVYGWWGGFHAATVVETESSPHRYAYLAYEGPIDNLRKTQTRALEHFERAGVAAGDTLAVILTDPRSNPHGKVKAQLGYELAGDAPLPDGLTEGHLPAQPVYRTTVHAAILLAPSKAYQALADRYGDAAIRPPTIERYHPAGKRYGVGVFTLDVPR